MAHLEGLSAPAYGFGTAQSAASAPAAAMSPSATMDAANGFYGVNGTPVRVVVIALAAAAGLTALRLAGFRFNVGVSA